MASGFRRVWSIVAGNASELGEVMEEARLNSGLEVSASTSETLVAMAEAHSSFVRSAMMEVGGQSCWVVRTEISADS